MIWVRKGIVHILSLLLFSALLAGTVAASIDIAFSHPAKVESWLSQSNLYSSFVSTAVKQANNSADSGGQSNGVSLNDVVVQQAAESAFSPALLRQDVKTFLDSNYAWLEGKTATPNFSIDLSSAKESFAQKVGQYVQAHLASLPLCTTAQALAQPTTDPLAMTCRPAVLDPTTAETQVTQQLKTGNGFLDNPVITANSLTQGNNNNGQPYYKKLSAAPRIYRAATSLPWVLAGASLLCAIGIFFTAPRKRAGLRRIGFVLLEVGILLTIVKLAADIVFKRIENKLFNQVNNGPLQQALTNFAHRAESQLVNVNAYFGIAFVAVAITIFVFLIITRRRATTPPKLVSATPTSVQSKTNSNRSKGTSPANMPTGTDQPKPMVTRSKRPRRLIQ